MEGYLDNPYEGYLDNPYYDEELILDEPKPKRRRKSAPTTEISLSALVLVGLVGLLIWFKHTRGIYPWQTEIARRSIRPALGPASKMGIRPNTSGHPMKSPTQVGMVTNVPTDVRPGHGETDIYPISPW